VGVILYMDRRANQHNRRAAGSADRPRIVHKRSRMNPAALRAGQAYRIDRESRRLEARAKSPADRERTEAKYQESLRIFRELKHRRGEAEVLNDLGIFYTDRERYAEAEDYFEKALKIKREIGWHWGACNTLAGLAVIRHNQGDFSGAVKYSEQAVKAYEKSGNKKSTTSMLCSLAFEYVAQGHHDKAILALKKAARIAGECGAGKIRRMALDQIEMLDVQSYKPAET
jgi:tetratricopeptide (TPR) repeat protein